MTIVASSSSQAEGEPKRRSSYRFDHHHLLRSSRTTTNSEKARAGGARGGGRYQRFLQENIFSSSNGRFIMPGGGTTLKVRYTTDQTGRIPIFFDLPKDLTGTPFVQDTALKVCDALPWGANNCIQYVKQGSLREEVLGSSAPSDISWSWNSNIYQARLTTDPNSLMPILKIAFWGSPGTVLKASTTLKVCDHGDQSYWEDASDGRSVGSGSGSGPTSSGTGKCQEYRNAFPA